VKKQLYGFLVLIALLATACNTQPDTPSNKALAIPQLHCAVKYPIQWTVAVSGRDSNQYTFIEPIQDSTDKFSTRISLWNEKIPFKISPHDYNQGVITLVKLSNPQLHIDPIPADSNNFLGYTFGFSDRDSSRFNVYGYTLLRDSFAFNITMTCEAGKETQYLDTLKQFLQHFTYSSK
jgi:hypothetical protein